jgi:hypothetical protein
VNVDGRLEVTVGGERWRAVATLDECGPDDPCFLLRIADNGSATLRFGDGQHGRRPPRGASVEAAYRHGGGNTAVDPSRNPLTALLDLIAEMADQVSHDLDQIYADAFIETAGGRTHLKDIADLRTVIADHRVEFVVRLKRRPRHRPKRQVAT